MGDADSEIMVPVEELRSWMDEAIDQAVDEGLDNLFSFMMNANNRSKQLLLQLKSLECFLNWFLALNLLIVPVVLSILICYSTRNTIDSAGLEPGFQLAVTFLMFLSGSLGLPLYFIALWESYACSKNLKEEIGFMRNLVPRDEIRVFDSSSLAEDNLPTLTSCETSLENLNNFARILTDLMPERMRLNLEGRMNIRFPEPSVGSEDLQILSMRRGLSHEIPTASFDTGVNILFGINDENRVSEISEPELENWESYSPQASSEVESQVVSEGEVEIDSTRNEALYSQSSRNSLRSDSFPRNNSPKKDHDVKNAHIPLKRSSLTLC